MPLGCGLLICGCNSGPETQDTEISREDQICCLDEDTDLERYTGLSEGEEGRTAVTASDESETESDTIKPAIRDHIRVEAGKEALVAEDFFEEYHGEEILWEPELSTEELMKAGETYALSVEYQEAQVNVTVEIVDTTPPVIEAQDIEVEQDEPVSYKKNVSLTDNSDGEIILDVDASQADTAVPGVYTILYTATDSSGNSSTAECSLTVREKSGISQEQVNQMADELIEELVTSDMSSWDTAYALWNWCRTKIKYTYSAGDMSSIYTGAYEGLHDRKGDCFVYYATFAVLLNRVGIENMCVTRVGGDTDHYWNLVNLGDGWYHCDSSPRRSGHTYYCFMQTDEQVQWYTDYYTEKPDYYTFDPDLYPERATEIVFEHY